MYESHFGFSGSPFQLNPDPAFYFDSRGHSNALAYLKFGAHQGEGFIVVTGEIGAGKTTLVRTLLEGLNPDQVVAAQVVSTQLESSELLQAILMAFGIPSPNNSKAHLIASLEAYLTALAAKGRRALLIIDEAQNLKHEAVEELRMLSNFQLGKYGLLQSFLVGQPELRGLLQSKSMEQLRQRVIASCHLGPLDEAETRAYIEHRLKRVGWNGSIPMFGPGTFEAVHRWTGGVPRKINRLCNRMLLGAFLANANVISLALVDETAAELRNEIGEAAVPSAASVPIAAAPEASPAAPTQHARHDAIAPPAMPEAQGLELAAAEAAPTPPAEPNAVDATTQAADGRAEMMEPAAAAAAVSPASPVIAASAEAVQPAPARQMEEVVHRSGDLTNPVICLVDSQAGYLKAGLLQDVFEGFPSLPRVLALHLGPPADLMTTEMQARGLPLPARGLHLGIPAAAFASRSARVFDAVAGVFDDLQPSAVMVLGNSNDDLILALLANKRGLRLLRVGSGERDPAGDPAEQLNAVVIERLADLQFTDSTASFYALYREGIRLDRVRSVGNLTNEMLDHALSSTSGSATDGLDRIAPEALCAPEGYGLVDVAPATTDTQEFASTLRRVCEFGAALPLVWAVSPQSYSNIVASPHAAALKTARVTLIREPAYFSWLGLLRGAKCLVSRRDGHLREEAKSLRIPVLELDQAGNPQMTADGNDSKPSRGDADMRIGLQALLLDQVPASGPPEYWHIGTASRIAGHLVTWMARSPANNAQIHADPSTASAAQAAPHADAAIR